MSSHPLAEHEQALKEHVSHQAKELATRPHGEMAIAAVVIGRRMIKTRAGKMMAVSYPRRQHGTLRRSIVWWRTNRRGEYEPGPYDRFYC